MFTAILESFIKPDNNKDVEEYSNKDVKEPSNNDVKESNSKINSKNIIENKTKSIKDVNLLTINYVTKGVIIAMIATFELVIYNVHIVDL